ncbi:MAG: DUF4294 domain-containing protein [Rikenellaceae bacterium]|nr:DUF4294 domain-containing protein [Rikenellaceae bacterium]
MKRWLVTLLALCCSLCCCLAQGGRGYSHSYIEVTADGDTIVGYQMLPVYSFRRKVDMRRYQRMIDNLKKVYPIACEAQRLLAQMEREIVDIADKKEQKAYVKRMEQELKAQYTPVLRTMTRSQGKILIKLIDRQTDRTSYEIVRQLRGGFSAFFWQGVARLFGANLKSEFDAEGEDELLDRLILLYEAGLL